MPESREPTRRPSRRLRCAIYTRKSSDEGLEQAFNSLDAQREACAAFVISQKHEGWSVLPTLYDDGGYSGGTLDRPALQRLLADIADGKVDVVVVYKIDRLTRSLFDFAKIVEAFDAKGISFVSITQQFNTTTSMGRLTLNVLLSFAQFEREVAGERIRDKIAASKKKGMWMGGLPSLGYDVRDRKLVVNEEEAQIVLHIFRRYVELRSVRALKLELDPAGIRSKHRTFADGTIYGGHRLSRGALYLMLQNRIYRGEITHKGNAYPGEHKAIVDKALWDRVQSVLAENRVDRTTGADAKYPSLLAGLAFDDNGERLTPTHAVKKGTRYRYYVARSLITGAAKDHLQGRRMPAGNLENLVIGRLRAFLADEGAMLSAISDAEENGAEQKRLIARGRQISREFPAYWTLLCLPFAVLSSFIAAELILRLFLTPDQRETRIAPIEIEGSETAILKQPIVWVLGLVLIGWLTAPWHGINETLIAIVGALLITAPHFGAIGLKEGLNQVDWNLLVFLAATISLAQTMVRTDLPDQLLDGPFGDIEDVGLSPLVIAAMIGVIGMALHLIVHSRTARVAVLLPPVLLVADEGDLNPVSMMLVTVAATGFCQTLLVSAKPVIMFGKIDGVTYTQGDLLRLSAVLAPVHLALIVLFMGVIWPWLGVDLVSGDR